MSASLTARRLTAAALAAGALAAVTALPASADHGDRRGDRHGDRNQVVISAVQYDPPGRDDRSNRSLNREWVEITNTGRRSVDLDGWTLSDRDGRTYEFDRFRLDGRSSVRVHTGTGRDSRTDVFQDRRRYVWDDRFDTVILSNERGREIDSESWGGRGYHHRR
ncbi:lamin tail domain-containing protein [Streptomyces sp. NPDC089424]|uniref:lamin tail domain-containing protein n=1 Tax=Streptomyces sp. NPDC089424 TaxID=3365917 RepID=UPI0037F7EB94